MYQLLLIMSLLLSIGGAVVISISHGSAAKAYTSLSTQSTSLDTVDDDAVARAERLASADVKDESLISAVFKSILGVETDVNASPILMRTITGTYACNASSTSALSPPCESSYVFVFKPNSAAVLKIENIDGTTTATQVGTWSLNKDGQIVVTLFADNKGRLDQERIFTLLRGSRAQLITLDYPRESYPDIVTGIFKFIKK